MKTNKYTALRFLLLLGVITALLSQTACFWSTTSLTTAEVEDGIYQQVNEVRQQHGLSVLTRDADLDAQAQQYAASRFSTEIEQSSEISYLVRNAWKVTYDVESPRLGEDNAQKQVEYCLGITQLSDIMLKSEARATGVGVAVVGKVVYYTQVFDVLNAATGDGQPIRLYENAQAVDPSWAQLKQFIISDNTDKQLYVSGQFVCADFAAMLHNRAEQAGIKAAYVSVNFVSGPGHALDAFVTMDRGLVYIDCTGSGFQNATSADSFDSQDGVIDYDKVAYIVLEQDYGLIPLDKAIGFDYTYYQQWEQQWADYNQKVDLYNSGTLPPHEQQTTGQELESLKQTLGSYNWQTLGTVTDLYVHW